MRQGPHVLGNVMLGTQDRVDPVAGVVDPVLYGHGPFQDRTQAQANPPGRLRLPVADRGEDLKRIGAPDLRDRHLPLRRQQVAVGMPMSCIPQEFISGVINSGWKQARNFGAGGA